MKKNLILGLLIFSSMAAMAGGLVTNTNMSVAYLRNPAREGAIDEDGVYFNPAGTAFLSDGLHACVSLQTAMQERIGEVTFDPLALNKNHLNEASRSYKGTTLAPVIPAIYLTYNWDRWNVQAAFNIVGGGGKAKYEEGIGQFEALVAGKAIQLKGGLSQLMNLDENVAYSLNSNVTGESYQYVFYLGTSFEIIREHLAVSLGAQCVYAKNHYTGGLTDMQLWMGENFGTPAYDYLMVLAGQMAAAGGTLPTGATAMLGAIQNIPDITLDATQKGFSATPVIGLDYQINSKFNLSVRYQARTFLKLKTKANNSASSESLLPNFSDGKELRSDIPSYYLFGFQYTPIEQLRLALSYRSFNEKRAKRDMVNNANKKNEGTDEYCFGIEWDIFKYLTFSCGYQGCFFGQSDEEFSELDFQVNSNSILAGFRVNLGDHWKIDLGYMHTFYVPQTITKQMAEDGSLPYKTRYDRKNTVFGIGLSCAF